MILLLTDVNRAQRQLSKPDPEGQPIPTFNILLTDGVTRVSTGTIPPGSPVVLVLFSPQCPYCTDLVESIVPQIGVLPDIRFYFITPCPMAEVQQFSRHYQLNKYANVVVGMDYDNFLLCHTNTRAIPYTAVYDGNMQLKEAVFGQTDGRRIKEIVYR